MMDSTLMEDVRNRDLSARDVGKREAARILLHDDSANHRIGDGFRKVKGGEFKEFRDQRAQMGQREVKGAVVLIAFALIGAIIVAHLYDEIGDMAVLNETGLADSIDTMLGFFGTGLVFAGIVIFVAFAVVILRKLDRI